MRSRWLVLLLVVLHFVLVHFVSGCALPEDTYFVSGETTPSTEVRLLRNRFGSRTRCDALELIDITTTGADGRFSFPVVRQQITGGESERRFFSVEFGDVDTEERAWRFQFPDADLQLGRWNEPNVAPVREFELDGFIAWRGGGLPINTFDRDVRSRSVRHAFEFREVPIDSLGRVDYVPLETRVASAWAVNETSMREPPRARGVECPFIDVKPCPLTDGRFLPFTMPPDSRTLVFNFRRELAVRGILFHGLVLERPAVRVRYDFNFLVDFEQWNPWLSSMLDPGEFSRESEFCNAPGASLAANANNVKPVIFRVRFEDAEQNLIPIVSLQEVTIQ